MPSSIFVFGSNLAGVHGAGAAKHAARYFGAEFGVGFGRTGACYAIPTKDERIRVLPLSIIRAHVANFLEYAREHPDETFRVTALGTGLAGYTHSLIAPMFEGAPSNCMLPIQWKTFLQGKVQASFIDWNIDVIELSDNANE